MIAGRRKQLDQHAVDEAEHGARPPMESGIPPPGTQPNHVRRRSGYSMPRAIAATAMIDPMDRSTWRATITSICPIAAIMISGVEQQDHAQLVQRQELRLVRARRPGRTARSSRRCRPRADEDGLAARSCRAPSRRLRHRGLMIVSCVASARGMSAVRRPSDITSTRSQSASSSGSSEEISRIARPSAASCADHVVELGLDADVDAARRLVEDQHVRIGQQPARRGSPSAGCRRTARRSAGAARRAGCAALHRLGGQRPFDRAADDAAGRDPVRAPRR